LGLPAFPSPAWAGPNQRKAGSGMSPKKNPPKARPKRAKKCSTPKRKTGKRTKTEKKPVTQAETDAACARLHGRVLSSADELADLLRWIVHPTRCFDAGEFCRMKATCGILRGLLNPAACLRDPADLDVFADFGIVRRDDDTERRQAWALLAALWTRRGAYQGIKRLLHAVERIEREVTREHRPTAELVSELEDAITLVRGNLPSPSDIRVKDGSEMYWQDEAPEYISNAGALLIALGLPTPIRMELYELTRLLTPNGEIRYMRKNRRCKVRVGDWMAYLDKEQHEIQKAREYDRRGEAEKDAVAEDVTDDVVAPEDAPILVAAEDDPSLPEHRKNWKKC